MIKLLVDHVDALLPLGVGVLLLACPQLFTKKDLKADENERTVSIFKKAGVLLLCASALIFIASLGRS